MYMRRMKGKFTPPLLRKFNHLLLSACLLAGPLFTSCQDDYDDTALWDTVNDLEQRLAALEEWQNEVNHNIQSLYELINTTDYITSVSPYLEGGVEVGYTPSPSCTATPSSSITERRVTRENTVRPGKMARTATPRR